MVNLKFVLNLKHLSGSSTRFVRIASVQHLDNLPSLLSIPETVPVKVGEAKFAFKLKHHNCEIVSVSKRCIINVQVQPSFQKQVLQML
jgi:hypothetical protein